MTKTYAQKACLAARMAAGCYYATRNGNVRCAIDEAARAARAASDIHRIIRSASSDPEAAVDEEAALFAAVRAADHAAATLRYVYEHMGDK